jgi:hypothetical protein
VVINQIQVYIYMDRLGHLLGRSRRSAPVEATASSIVGT